MKFILVGSAIVTLLTVAAAVAPWTFPFLPLGGSPISEIGVVFGVCFSVATVIELFKEDQS
ncbi:MAG: hypothetical protein CMH66_08080 [Nioella sp.]|nr:hypothetical protein [Nioella sp.]